MLPRSAFFASENLEFSAAADETSGPSFKGVAYSGGPVPRTNFDGSASLIDIASFQLNIDGKEVFILADHDNGRKVGKALAKSDGKKILIENGVFFDNDHGREAKLLMSQGAPYELSVGILGDVQYHSPNDRKKKTVMGESVEIGSEIFNARLLEVSFVTSGADPRTSVAKYSAQQGFTSIGEKPMSDEKTVEEPKSKATEPTVGDAVKLDRLAADNKRLTDLYSAAQTTIQSQNDAIKALRDEVAASDARHETLLSSVRTKELTAVFGDKMTEAEKKHFLSLPEETFAVVVKKFDAFKPADVKKDGAMYKRTELSAAESEGRPAVSRMEAAAIRNKLIKKAEK